MNGALISIAIILYIALRRLLDMSLVLAPLLLSSLMTVVVIVLAGLMLNYANASLALPQTIADPVARVDARGRAGGLRAK